MIHFSFNKSTFIFNRVLQCTVSIKTYENKFSLYFIETSFLHQCNHSRMIEQILELIIKMKVVYLDKILTLLPETTMLKLRYVHIKIELQQLKTSFLQML